MSVGADSQGNVYAGNDTLRVVNGMEPPPPPPPIFGGPPPVAPSVNVAVTQPSPNFYSITETETGSSVQGQVTAAGISQLEIDNEVLASETVDLGTLSALNLNSVSVTFNPASSSNTVKMLGSTDGEDFTLGPDSHGNAVLEDTSNGPGNFTTYLYLHGMTPNDTLVLDSAGHSISTNLQVDFSYGFPVALQGLQTGGSLTVTPGAFYQDTIGPEGSQIIHKLNGLVLSGGSFATETDEITGGRSDTITFDDGNGPVITYSDVDLIEDGATVTNYTAVNTVSGPNQAIDVQDAASPSGPLATEISGSSISSARTSIRESALFSPIYVSEKSSITADGNANPTTFNVTSSAPANLGLNGGSGQDTLQHQLCN